MKPQLCVAALAALAPLPSAQGIQAEKYRLDNGMTVILHEDHASPQVCVNLWYGVGSKDEKPGRSGFAHLFEHLMFMGTERVPEGQFDIVMETGGGFNNATTSSDRTNYFEMGPAELLPTLLWLEADRLEDIGRMMTQEKLDLQREVVRNERRQSYENRPYGNSQLVIQKLMYPEGHPYHDTTIGSHEDLEAATVEDVQEFFATYYVPNNASLVVVGDFDSAEVKPLVARLFGTLPRGAEVEHADAEPVELSGPLEHTETDRVPFARSTFVYHSPAHFAPGDAEMDLVSGILASDISSRLVQRLVATDAIASEVEAYQWSQMLGSLFVIQATARPGVELDEIERAIDEVVDEFLEQGPTADELARTVARTEYGMVSSLESLFARADALNRYEYHFGDPLSFERDLGRYRSATIEGVRDTARRVLRKDRRLVMRVLPEAEEPDLAAGNPRDEQPGIDDPPAFEALEPESFELSNGIRVHHWEKRELPLFELRALLPFGSAADGAGRAGLANLVADMLDEGAAGRTATEFADELSRLGAEFDASVDVESTELSLSSLARNAVAALRLVADAVQRPNFDPAEWKRVHELQVQQLQAQLEEPNIVARRAGMRAFFGDEHPYAWPVAGTVDSIQRIDLEAVKQFHRLGYRPSNLVLLTAGDLSTGEIRAVLEETFGTWKDTKIANLPRPDFSARRPEGGRLLIVDRPGAVQTVVNFVTPAPAYPHPGRTERSLLGTLLGGSFTSRLNSNLREDKGYTYGARCSFSAEPSAGWFNAGASVRADVTGASLREFFKEFEALRGGDVTPEEARKARSVARSRIVRSQASLGAILGAAARLLQNGEPFDAPEAELAEVQETEADDLNAVARESVALEDGILVLVGDRAAIVEQIADLDLPAPEDLAVTGEPRPRRMR